MCVLCERVGWLIIKVTGCVVNGESMEWWSGEGMKWRWELWSGWECGFRLCKSYVIVAVRRGDC